VSARAILAMFVAAALALAIAIAFDERSTPDHEQHARFTQLVADRHVLDQDIARHALESRFAFQSNYDQLAQQDRHMRKLEAQLTASVPDFIRGEQRGDLERASVSYDRLSVTRGQLLEHFKSENALLRNSIGYFPTAVTAALGRTHDPELVDAINELRGSTLTLALIDSASAKATQRAAADRIASLTRGKSPTEEQRLINSMLVHANAIAVQKAQTDGLLEQMLDLPIDDRRRAFSQRYDRAFQAAERQSRLFGRFVSGLSLLLLGIVAYAGVRLQRAATNLGRANERLELAVKERTAELEGEMALRTHAELELRQAQKLEAVGQLASGIAHEINTPIQYVGDSIYFLRQAFEDMMRLVDGYRAFGPPGVQSLPACEDIDLDFLRTEVPEAFERTADGTRQVASIVQAMKTFAHTSVEKVPVDLNAAVENTLIVARNEYKYVADVKLELGSLPDVTCNAGGIRQVLINLIINAAHAIADKNAGSVARGTIGVRTELCEERILIAITDNGGGIPEDIRLRIFDPFFTTKEPGRGSGQGLAISQRIVSQHGGKLWFETKVGVGSTFFVQLPLVSSDVYEGEDTGRAA
jgi:signal transduction histidine kinase